MNKWQQFVFNKSHQLIFWLFYILFAATYLFALVSPNLRLGDNAVYGTSTTLFLMLFIATLVVLVSLYYAVPVVQRAIQWLFVTKQVITSSSLFLLLVGFQVLFIQQFHPTPGWDVGTIHEALIHPTNQEIQSYFSLNQNNLPILLVQVKLAHLFGSTSWLFLDYVTLILVDSSAIMLIMAATIIDRKYYATATYLHVFLFAVFPWIVVPYTDTWVLPLVSGMLLCYVMTQKMHRLWMKNIAWAGLGVFVVGCYFMKPSAVIPFIAIVLIEVLFSLRLTKDKIKPALIKSGLGLLFVGLAFGGSYYVVKQKLVQQHYLTIQQERGIPMLHFINTGLSQDGAYDPLAALKMATLPTKQAKNDYSKEQIVQRLNAYGILGYGQFLITKQKNNTADGTFGWYKEGSFFTENPKPEIKTGLTGLFKQSLFLYGEYIANFRFIAQMVWILLLSCLFFSWKNRTKMIQFLRLALIGGFLFLLVFEGGRSRYLIQFLPVFLLFASLTANESWLFLKNLFTKIGYTAS